MNDYHFLRFIFRKIYVNQYHGNLYFYEKAPQFTFKSIDMMLYLILPKYRKRIHNINNTLSKQNSFVKILPGINLIREMHTYYSIIISKILPSMNIHIIVMELINENKKQFGIIFSLPRNQYYFRSTP